MKIISVVAVMSDGKTTSVNAFLKNLQKCYIYKDPLHITAYIGGGFITTL